DPAGFHADDRLDVRARMVLQVIAHHADREGMAWPGYRRISQVGGVAPRHIRGCLDRLEEAERIQIVRRSRWGNRYRLLSPPPWASSDSTGGSPKPSERS